MRLSDEMVLQDDKRFANYNALAEFRYCGREIPHRKSITNDNIHFYAWLFRSAVAMLKEQEAKTPVKRVDEGYWYYRCPTCEHHEDLLREWNYCPFCGQAVKWNEQTI